MRFDYLVLIGRFQPFHNGHASVLKHALRLARKVIVLTGSAGQPRTIRNPFNAAERAVMIRAAAGEDAARLIVEPLRDRLYGETLWVGDVQRLVAEAVARDRAGEGATIGLIGRNKDDATAAYLAAFPQWELVDVQHAEVLSATELRDWLFTGEPGALRLVEANVPGPVYEMLGAFRDGSPAYAQLAREHAFIKTYRQAWAAAPHAPTFVTADAVVVHSGHVLLVKRRAEPGRGLWALPGGFVNQGETVQEAAIRELHEETRAKIPPAVLRGSIKASRVFDHPDRSLRGRTITHAFHFDFPAGPLPRVKGSDDAEQARWVPISEALLMEEQFFEDHFHILEHFVGA
ncbi:bifunctional nicotinamide-nucleotide adenylyltransferase/Nudix hydroxylase [Caulobacter sp. CCNWLY153]|uniref:bifunctional nicotinamide-nucleotide adenylyltransferase/Nudix hydroxylase n=1 Tax=unclassified Caulobacter TaxID=2648921 RepID=UPI002FF4266F